MPKLTLVLERKPIRVYDIDQPVIAIGRLETVDIAIDNVSVSRRHAQLRREEDGTWTVRDMGSANGTFLNGRRVTDPQPLRPGDEISVGKFSLFFERVLTEPLAEADVAPTHGIAPARSTYQLAQDDVERLRQAGALKRQAQIQWEAGDRRGTHYLRAGAVLVGRSELCDLRVPVGPKHHVLILRGDNGFEVRNLSTWYRMKVNGQVSARAALKSGDAMEVGGLRLTFLDEMR